MAAGSLCLALRQRARRRRRLGALRARAPTCAPRVTELRTLSPGGSGDVEDVVCCALLERLGRSVQGVLRAPAEGEGGVAHREDLAATASTTLRGSRDHARAERRYGVAHGKRAARGDRRPASPPLQGLAPPARRPHAPPARRPHRTRAAGAPATRAAGAPATRPPGQRHFACGGGRPSKLTPLPPPRR